MHMWFSIAYNSYTGLNNCFQGLSTGGRFNSKTLSKDVRIHHISFMDDSMQNFDSFSKFCMHNIRTSEVSAYNHLLYLF